MLLTLATYAVGGRRFEHLPGNPELPAVVLVHGLLHRGIVMRSLAKFLNGRGYPVYIYDYKTTRSGIVEHGRKFMEFLRSLPEERVGIVTHSMGGLLTRVALCGLSGTPEAAKIGRVVMLAPPHHGSQMAEDVSRRFPPSKLMVRPLAELSNREGAVCRTLPVPRGFEIGVVAGDDDGKVSIESTKLDGHRGPRCRARAPCFYHGSCRRRAARSSPFSTPGASFIELPAFGKSERLRLEKWRGAV